MEEFKPYKAAYIDFSNLAHAIYYRCSFLLNKDRKKDDDEIIPTEDFLKEHIDIKIKSIQFQLKDFPLVFVLDAGRSNKNELLGGDYKSNRKQLPISPTKILAKYILNKGYTLIYSDNEEADDTIATCVNSLKQQDINSVIVSTDHDLIQLVNKHTQMLNLTTFEYINKDLLMTKYGLNKYRKIVWYKTFFGDTSDNIPTLLFRVRKKPILELFNSSKLFKPIMRILAKEYNLDKQIIKNRYKAIKLKKNLIVKQLYDFNTLFKD